MAACKSSEKTSAERGATDEDLTMSRCLFCQTSSGKRSKEHVFRDAFKTRFPAPQGLTFSWRSASGNLEFHDRPISQFDITLNAVCRECNQGWLEDLENAATAVIHELTVGNTKLTLSELEVQTLGFWAYVRALLLTLVYPRGRVPDSFFQSVFRARRDLAIPSGSFVSLGASTHRVFEAGVVQSATIRPGDHYLGFVGFGLGALVFLVAISDESTGVSALAREIIEAPRAWFPDCFRRLDPIELPALRLRLLTGEQALLACQSMRLRFESDTPRDQLGNAIDPRAFIPARFHADLAYPSPDNLS
jgi:hypothetical protein